MAVVFSINHDGSQPHNKKAHKIASINTQGLKSNSDYILNTLVKSNDIIFVCEHWLSNAEKHILKNRTHKLYFSSAEKQAAGRPYGGNCFLVRNDINNDVKVVHEDPHVLAIQIPKLNTVFIGIYLTCYHDASSKEEYISQLNTINGIIEMYLEESEIVIMGDYQTFPSLIYDNSPFSTPQRFSLHK